MTQLYTKVKKYLEANSKTVSEFDNNIRLQDDNNGNGSYIHTWSVDALAKPTDEQLATYEDVANEEEALNTVLGNRRNEYPAIVDQLDDLYHNGIDGWKATIKVTKDKYPKE